jgi:uncharacterized membrane protein YccC
MAEPTEQDREKADLIVDRINWIGTSPEDVCADIAQALADERQAAEDRVVAAEAERDALKVERDRLREVAKTSLCVLCAAKDGQSWSLPMAKDFDIAIGMCRAALSPPKPQEGGDA